MKMESAESFEAEQLFVDLDKPSLRGLSYVLRHPETWHPDFVWNYKSCETCAIGLARKLWSEVEEDWQYGVDRKWHSDRCIATSFGIDAYDACKIFISGGVRGLAMEKIIPEMVADDIDAYLARQQA